MCHCVIANNQGEVKMKILANMVCALIPSKKLRHRVRLKIINKPNIYKELEAAQRKIIEELKSIEKRLVSKDDIYNFKNGIKFYLPFYPVDYIQRIIIDENDFYEGNTLRLLDEKINLNEESIILDIGANIGNHSIYWSIIDNVKRVYSFEPVKTTFDILTKNIELNHLGEKIVANNIGFGEKECLSNIKDQYSMLNIGGTSLEECDNGEFKITTLDNYIKENFKDNKIDFVKIDVEGFEYKVLLGAEKTLKKYKPAIFIESWEKNFEKVNELLESYGYDKTCDFPGSNYLYEYKI